MTNPYIGYPEYNPEKDSVYGLTEIQSRIFRKMQADGKLPNGWAMNAVLAFANELNCQQQIDKK